MYEVVVPLGARPPGRLVAWTLLRCRRPTNWNASASYDPSAPDAGERLELIAFLLENGATLEQFAQGPQPGGTGGRPDPSPSREATLAEVVQSMGADFDQARRLLSSPGSTGLIPMNG